jgi:large subunit ribosomal protein L7/L12
MSEDVKEDTKENIKEVEVPQKFEKIVKEIEEMTVLDLSELVSVLEEKFGVSASAPMVVAAAPAAGDGSGNEVAEKKSSYNVELIAVGDQKIAVIKAVRAAAELGLKDAKDLVDAAPKMIKENVPKEEAEEMKKAIEEAGGSVELK